MKTRGQSLTEFALVAPVVLVLVLMALDFGRLFLSVVSLNNMARVGAYYGALHPETWDAADSTEYVQVMLDNGGVTNCALNPSPPAEPIYGGTRDIGDPVTVRISCDFRLITPLIGQLIGPTIPITSESTFAISLGCIDDCPTGPPAPTPTPPVPPTSNCREIPDMEGMSVAGARDAWVAAGFTGAFDPPTGDDTRTVDSQSITEPPNAEGCTGGEALFESSVTVTLVDQVTPPPTATCAYVPNMIGMTVADARDAWDDALFTGTFTPASGDDDRIVLDQTTTPASEPGVDCIEPDAAVTVTHGPPLPTPPVAPCRVPSLVNTDSQDALAVWTTAGFTGELFFDKPQQLEYTIKVQTLVGGTYQSCASSMTVGPNPSGGN